MAKRARLIPIDLFVRRLHRKRVQGKWHELQPWDESGPWKGKADPWSAVATWIGTHTGSPSHDVEQYMSEIVRPPPKKVDPYVSRELFAWWEDGNGDKLIRAFWDSYPEVAESMRDLPKPIRAVDEDALIPEEPLEKLVINHGTYKAFWGGSPLLINSNADFAVLAALAEAKGNLVSYKILLSAIDAMRVSDLVNFVEAPAEVKYAVSHINKALRDIQATIEVKNVPKRGYRLGLRDE